MSEIVARFEVRYSRCLDSAGNLVAPLPATACNPQQLIALYRAMVRTRAFDAKAGALQRTGRLGTFASSLGQEAVPVGAASAMREADVLLPSFREHGAQLWRGVTPSSSSCIGAATNEAVISPGRAKTSRSAYRWAACAPRNRGGARLQIAPGEARSRLHLW
jgi:TPP-dependent pyruvate/acetoin dehydrogenase alpha subunit